MRLVPLLIAVAACALAAVTTIAYLTKPADVRVQYRATATKPTLAQFKRLVGPIETTAATYSVRADTGGTVYCARADSTFSSTEARGITWQAQWCWNVPRAEAVANGLLQG